MGSVLEQAGATREPSQYATLTMDRGVTGLWTQRSPLRDADVPYLVGKFYAASRFDSIIDGINREIGSDLGWNRRAGSSVFNSNSFPAGNSFYAFKRIVSGSEVVRVIYDGKDGVIYDATPGQKTTIFTKSGGAGKARFQGVNTSLYFTDGVENKKWLQPATWLAQTSLATTQYAVGTYILDNESPAKLQYLSSVKVGTITNVEVTANAAVLTFSSGGFNLLAGASFTPAGLGAASFLNGQLLFASAATSSGGNFIVTAQFAHAPYASAADTGTASTSDVGTEATTGNVQPTWATTPGSTTTDGLSTWTNFGNPLYDWGPPNAPSNPINVSNIGTKLVFWQPLTSYPAGTHVLMDSEGFVWRSTGTGRTGPTIPKFSAPLANGSTLTLGKLNDGSLIWWQGAWLGSSASYVAGYGSPWQAGVTPSHIAATATPNGDYCIDSNGNLQQVTAGAGATGGSAPTWNTAIGGATTDNGLTWTNTGPWLALVFQGRKWGYSYECIDGSESTLSPLTDSSNAMVEGAFLAGLGSADPTCCFVKIYATADGQSLPLFLARIPNPGGGVTWNFIDSYADSNLVAEEVGAQAEQNNPPPVGMTAPLYHSGRIWAIYKNMVICSGGPDTLVGNGNTSFPPRNAFPIPEQPIRLFSTITSAGPALLIWGRVNLYIILGQGTLASPFQEAARYMESCGIQNYDAVTKIGATFYAFGNTALVNGQIVGKAFSLDPGAGYVEYGFPIGDQFQSVTTGAGGRIPNSGVALGHLYDPASTYVTWAELGSGDTALYVADGAVGWFRYSPVASPESGFLWSPRAVIVGGTSAVQGVETQPGVTQLLIAPASSGPILFRDSAVNADWHSSAYAAYPSYDVKGCIQLCLSGEIGEIAHVHLVSAAQGARPSVGLLFGEILPTQAAPFAWYEKTSSEPPNLPPSATVYSDRYTMLSNGVTPKCLFFQLGVDYGTQNVPDKLFMFSVYGAKYAERQQR